jgi:type III restriction enzyme
MSDTTKYLFEDLNERAYKLRLKYPEIPKYITDNIKFELFDWQNDALLNFLNFEQVKDAEEDYYPTHLMFNMATGTGKTLLMAAVILYYYNQGYRDFIFFVNQNNIVGKTEENLTNPSHNKYLFNQTIVIDNKTVKVKKVNTFANDSEDIQIKFTSIQKLHNDIYKVKEDSIFLEDLQKRNIVMLGDEAHHLNADTKKNKSGQSDIVASKKLSETSAAQADIEKSWEHTVVELLLNKGKKEQDSPNGNALLEFTATVPEDKEVKAKYLPKTIAKFDLKAFLEAGYTKEINLVSSSYDKRKRVLQALLFNWYRHKIALKHGLSNFKPVILFRSKTIDESEQDFEYFLDLIDNLNSKDFDFLKEINEADLFDEMESYLRGKSRIIDVKHFIDENSISFQEVITYLNDCFGKKVSQRTCIITNSKDETAKGPRGGDKTTVEQDKLLNSLEDKDNHIRAIFTVQRLTEGWDVQNLFDIVRLYEGRDERKESTGKRKAGKATTSEVQLIGRGVRYYPFKYEEKILNKRKFDKDLGHELRVLEEFYFHSDDNHRYIDELKRKLKEKGWVQDNRVVKKFQLTLDFQETDFYKDVKLFHNTKEDNANRKKKSLKEIKAEFDLTFAIESLNISEVHINLSKDAKDDTRFKTEQSDNKTIAATLKKFERHIIFKAINTHAKRDNSVFKFNKLKEELDVKSVDELLDSKYLGEFPINIVVDKARPYFTDITNNEQLKILTRFFEKVSDLIGKYSIPHIGSEFKSTSISTYFQESKTKSIVEDENNNHYESLLKDKKWYVLDGFHGTTEEQGLIQFIIDTMDNFEQQYEKVYLLRNEEVYKIYNFKDGQGFHPDFLLFLKEKGKELYYQVFIEPKGSQFEDKDGGFAKSKEGWKETFLEEISIKYGIAKKDVINIESKEYKLVGLPLYNKKPSIVKVFKDKTKELLNLEI